jgi:hypothetical protein
MIDELDKLSALPKGWHYGSGIGTTLKAYNAAYAILKALEYGFFPIELFPRINGGVLICMYYDKSYEAIHKITEREWMIDPDGTVKVEDLL